MAKKQSFHAMLQGTMNLCTFTSPQKIRNVVFFANVHPKSTIKINQLLLLGMFL
jgi:hypothetical protein